MLLRKFATVLFPSCNRVAPLPEHPVGIDTELAPHKMRSYGVVLVVGTVESPSMLLLKCGRIG